MTSMQESAMKGPELNGSDAANQNHRVVSVEGYNPSLQPYHLKLMLEKHFSSCGKITNVLTSRDLETGLLESSAAVFFDEESAEDKALELSGSYLGGWKIVVARGNYSDYLIDDEDDEDDEEDEEVEEDRRMIVFGIDPFAPELDVKIKLCEHFSSCGEVTKVMVCGLGKTDSICFAHVSIRGQDATDKAKNLNVDGENIIVGSVLPTNAERKQRFEHNAHLRNTTGLYIHHCK